ncbi:MULTISPECIES: hypothetical protein [Methylosinus]|uniref:hypothetical protein n=1 Tax=Methylosinus TaxID=425 RepID=UPI00115D9007|nr:MULTISPECIES: hypothetical protein [Methylosinus]MBU3890084.1 hypothetical protein [Methylosinus sp. KRF6]
MSSGHSDWELQPFGYHATAVIQCAHCEPGRVVRGLVWLGVSDQPLHELSAAVARSLLEARFKIWFITPYETARPRGEASTIRFGDFTGWRRSYEAFREDGSASHDIVTASASDGCGLINLWLETSPQAADRSIADSVENLLAAIRITKNGG